MKTFFQSKKAVMLIVGILTPILASIVLPLLGVPGDVCNDLATRIAVQVASFILGQGVADGMSSGATSKVKVLDSKKVKATLSSIVLSILVSVIGIPAAVAEQIINLITGLIGSYNVGQGVADGFSGGKTASMPVAPSK